MELQQRACIIGVPDAIIIRHLDSCTALKHSGRGQPITKYHAQSEWIEDEHIQSILNHHRIEELHVRLYSVLLSELSMPEPGTAIGGAGQNHQAHCGFLHVMCLFR